MKEFVTNEFGPLGQTNIENNCRTCTTLEAGPHVNSPGLGRQETAYRFVQVFDKSWGRPARPPAGGSGSSGLDRPDLEGRAAWPRIIPPSPQPSRSRLGW